MAKRIKRSNELIPVDDSDNELFDTLSENSPEPLVLSYLPSFFTTASLPFRNLNKKEFIRKASNGISLILNSPFNVPYGKYGIYVKYGKNGKKIFCSVIRKNQQMLIFLYF